MLPVQYQWMVAAQKSNQACADHYRGKDDDLSRRYQRTADYYGQMIDRATHR